MKTIVALVLTFAFAATVHSQIFPTARPCPGRICIGCTNFPTCCPHVNGVCCRSGLNCCPAGFTCTADEKICFRLGVSGQTIQVSSHHSSAAFEVKEPL
ncbi:hypothetical protein L596_010585 [Steinernema carpocapsae]|uniref:Granulins domain-containing protein n=1 Tax=Steinernema carpocapsae TaxID=34508 RepID=A0A4U5PK67_STECR|nr:hypothetical protein L596_010585 [Steinernema carpocapsae]